MWHFSWFKCLTIKLKRTDKIFFFLWLSLAVLNTFSLVPPVVFKHTHVYRVNLTSGPPFTRLANISLSSPHPWGLTSDMKSVRKFTEQTCINTFCQHGHSVTGGQPQHSGIKRTTAGNMTQFPAGEEQEKGGDVTEIQSYITFVKSTGRNSLADLARDLERALLVVLFLKHLGGNGGSSRDPTHTKKIFHSLLYSFFVSVFLTLWLPLCLSSHFGPSQTHLHQHTHSRQNSGSPSLTG